MPEDVWTVSSGDRELWGVLRNVCLEKILCLHDGECITGQRCGAGVMLLPAEQQEGSVVSDSKVEAQMPQVRTELVHHTSNPFSVLYIFWAKR